MKTKDVIKIFGSAPTLAKCLGITAQAIYQWPEFVPKQWAYEIEVRTEGLLKFDISNNTQAKSVASYDMKAFVQKYNQTKG